MNAIADILGAAIAAVMKAVIAGLIIAAPARTERTDDVPDLPPPRYDHPFPGKLDLKIVPQTEIERVCFHVIRNLPPPYLACTKIDEYDDSLCHVWIAPAEDIRAAGHDPEHVRRHEIGHCNGWPGDQPN
jgi:hypothetical protein